MVVSGGPGHGGDADVGSGGVMGVEGVGGGQDRDGDGQLGERIL